MLGVPVCAVRCLSIQFKKLNRNCIFVTIINMVSAPSLYIGAKAVDQDHHLVCSLAAKENPDLYSMDLENEMQDKKQLIIQMGKRKKSVWQFLNILRFILLL